ncbi:Uncharacterised protein [Paraprevotella clara]|uniref:Uncharacterized protein n=1 Tax=Paraprevotella clara TaxID=454154 RepID=A0A6N3GMS9_9BACT
MKTEKTCLKTYPAHLFGDFYLAWTNRQFDGKNISVQDTPGNADSISPACHRNKRKQKQRNADFQKKGKHTRMRYFPPVRDTAGNNAFSCVAIFHFVILTFYLSTSIFLLAHNINSTWKPIYAMLHLHVFPNKPPEKGHTHFAVSPNDKVNSLTVDNGTT